jgi:hypothetical protein
VGKDNRRDMLRERDGLVGCAAFGTAAHYECGDREGDNGAINFHERALLNARRQALTTAPRGALTDETVATCWKRGIPNHNRTETG